MAPEYSISATGPTVPYGIVYAENPSALVLEFIGIMKKFSKIG